MYYYKITLIVGLPGSGKTFLGKELEAQGAYLIDDLNMIGLSILREAMHHYKHIVVTDVFLCRSKERESAKKFLAGREIEWIFFENNPEKCLKNVLHRNDGRKVENLIKQLSQEYTIDEGIIPRIIYQ